MSYGEAIDEMLTIKLFMAGTNEVIFTLEAWTNAFNIDDPIYSELCHEFYSTYEFDEVCATEELRTKNDNHVLGFRGHTFLLDIGRFARGNKERRRRNYEGSDRVEKDIVREWKEVIDDIIKEFLKKSKEKEIDKFMALISLSFKKIYKPTNNNLRTSSNTSRANQDNSPRINRGTGYGNQRAVNVVGARENIAYHKEKMLLCKQEEARVQLNAEQADYKDDTDDEFEEQELKAHYMYMAQIQEVTPDPVDNSGPIFDDEPMHKDDQDETDDLDQERDLLTSLIQKLKYEIDESKNQNKFLESSNKELVNKLKGEIEDFKTNNKSLESSNNHFKEANNELSKTNQLMFKDLKKSKRNLDKYKDVNYGQRRKIDSAKN
ncbi:hypothetical protein Tco_0268882 [Tanacetum coccineum]